MIELILKENNYSPTAHTPEEIWAWLKAEVPKGTKVSIQHFFGSDPGVVNEHIFENTIQVTGVLEQGTFQSRVVVSDHDYAYFTAADIKMVLQRKSDDMVCIWTK